MVADVRAATPSHAAELIVPEREELVARLSSLHQQLQRAGQRDLSRRRQYLQRIIVRHPQRRIAEGRIRCDELGDQLLRAMMGDLGKRQGRLASATGTLEALSPLGVLARGYSLTLHEARAVRSSAELSPGDVVEIRLADGQVRAEILE
jgi:exodeoxyribonuclease VII large subunit